VSPCLEARPEADFCPQRGVLATTGRARHVWLRAAGATVGQVRQVAVPSARNGDVPRQPDVKVGIRIPQPVAPDFVVLHRANAPHVPRRELWSKGHLEQRGVHHRPIEIPAGELVGFQWEGPQPHRDYERARIGEAREDPQMGEDPKPVVEGAGDGVTAFGKARSGIGRYGREEAPVQGIDGRSGGCPPRNTWCPPTALSPCLRIRPEEAISEVRHVELESVRLQRIFGTATEESCMVPWATAHNATASISTPISATDINHLMVLSSLGLTLDDPLPPGCGKPAPPQRCSLTVSAQSLA
jgi:hypothetical protein